MTLPLPLVVFDLDDTLYREMDFVRSGFAAVHTRVAASSGASWRDVEAELMTSLERDGRGRQFDSLLESRPSSDEFAVADLVEIYRTHTPELDLPASSAATLAQLRLDGYRLFILTDGDPRVQRAKVRALGLERLVDGVICTWDEGPSAGKPNSRGFERLLSQHGTARQSFVYVADNPHKDFIAARRAGGHTVRVRSGPYSTVQPPTHDHTPDAEIDHIAETMGAIESLHLRHQ